jgi:septal ring factor EnvC (AmiA/AmiB activator)
MEFWTEQLEWAQGQIAEIENKIALQQQKAQELHAKGGDAALHERLIAVMKESLTRARTHAQYIEQRIAAHKSEPERRRRLAAARAAARDSPVRGQTPPT